ncbi:bifunctional cobalt-precorrin-7 (C(5))-methyltransferase/cobalt-precorrin-6B (C(15))-methyltransferase [Knoellia subterranea]|uniref:bifunctional cobalt-precorrin-7 (C(5))-methyltransferase/cobalt-precorrin-6B (C(15))-methyltransferase n=1 Tax=Knoellia subterranea TaxID=184882 RepID=UPI00068E9662|nr:bifunctional cobalt-precorrin-7 (C(5))-methyltransferase/cobalt-precorrin-6B (C(15))-methyltransferase [Knoellia subterranea]
MIDVVGVPAEGLEALAPAERGLVDAARVLVGSPRLLDLVPVREGQERRSWPSPMLPGLESFLAQVGSDGVVVLATGDPLVSGVGTTLLRVLGAGSVRVHPAVSSVALAHARMGWPSEVTSVVSLVSRPVYAVRPRLAPGARLVVLSAGSKTPVELARVLVEFGLGDARLTVLGHLGTTEESRFDCAAAELAAGKVPGPDGIPTLNVVAVEVPATAALWGTTPGLPDDAFAHDGQITKREIRAFALAALRPMPGQRLWDLGAGSGSVSVEWCLAADRAAAVAVERDAARAARVGENAAAYGVPVTVETGSSMDVVDELPTPDAVFIGGGASADLIDAAWSRLPVGGRLVVHCVTLDTEAVVVAAHGRHGGELRRVSVERAEPLGRMLSWQPARPIVQWSVTKAASMPATAEDQNAGAS